MVDRKGELKPAVHEELHADAEQRRLRMREYQHWKREEFTFAPDIGVNKMRCVVP